MDSQCENHTEEVRSGAGQSAFFEIPLPQGAAAGPTGTIGWAGLPFFLVGDSDLDPAGFGEFVFRTYEIDDSPKRVLEFFRDNRGDWEERFSAVKDAGGVLFWIKDGGQAAAWIATSAPGKGTELAIALAERGSAPG